MQRIYFDIETGSRPEDELAPLIPDFAAPANYKDPARIAAVLDEKRREWLERAALCATTGRVLAIGYRVNGRNFIFATGNEAADITAFWHLIEDAARAGDMLAGFSIGRFDLPFLIRRSWALGVRVPPGVFNRGWLNHKVFVDLAGEWRMGDRSEFISLKRLAEFLGVGTKDRDAGKLFAEHWLTSRKTALLYLENDLRLMEAVGERLLGPLPGAPAAAAEVSSTVEKC